MYSQPAEAADTEYNNLDDYYPIYLTQHADKTNRGLHLAGFILAFLQLLITIFDFTIFNIILIPVIWYGFAFAGHYLFEKNKPTSYAQPWLSLRCELRRIK